MLSCVWLFATPWTAACHSILCPSLSPGVCSNSYPSSQWCYLTISYSAVPFSFWLQSFPASGSFPVSQVVTSGGQSFGASASVLPMNIHGWFPLRLTGLISLLSKELSSVFSSATVRKHKFFNTQHSLWSSSHICACLWEKPQLWLFGLLWAKWCFCFLICCMCFSYDIEFFKSFFDWFICSFSLSSNENNSI